MGLPKYFTFLAMAAALTHVSLGERTEINGNARKDTKGIIESVLGKRSIEWPESHPDFGPHITQQRDRQLGRDVFAFYLHVNEDCEDENCQKRNKQRNEIKVFGNSPPNLKANQSDTFTYSWNFKLNSGFKASAKHTAFHQLKATGSNDDASPLVTISARKEGNGQVLRLEYQEAEETGVTIWRRDNLSKFVGTWLHVQETVTFGMDGAYSVDISRLDNGQTLLSYQNNNVVMWRQGNGKEYVRPKWGFYRGLGDKRNLRDETVLFDSFCISSDPDDECY